MKLETHLLNELHAFRYTGLDPKYALVISHGLGGHGGIYDVFCELTYGVMMPPATDAPRPIVLADNGRVGTSEP